MAEIRIPLLGEGGDALTEVGQRRHCGLRLALAVELLI
jgi:hypothetical protein